MDQMTNIAHNNVIDILQLRPNMYVFLYSTVGELEFPLDYYYLVYERSTNKEEPYTGFVLYFTIETKTRPFRIHTTVQNYLFKILKLKKKVPMGTCSFDSSVRKCLTFFSEYIESEFRGIKNY